jgi:hypothetical protein
LLHGEENIFHSLFLQLKIIPPAVKYKGGRKSANKLSLRSSSRKGRVRFQISASP